MGTTFHLVKHSIVAVNAQKANQVLGLTQFFQGHIGLAEVMAPEVDVATIAGEFNKALWSEFFLCQECYYSKGLCIAELMQDRIDNEATKAAEARV